MALALPGRVDAGPLARRLRRVVRGRAGRHPGINATGFAVARSGAFEDNPASVAVSRALGYADDGDEEHVRQGVPARMLRFKLTRERWEAARRHAVEVAGLEPCLPFFAAAPR